MDIGGINQNRPLELDITQKGTQNVKNRNLAGTNNPLIENENMGKDSEKEIKDAVAKINKFLEGEGTHVQYEKHDVLNQMIIKVIDNNTNEVVKEIPSKKILDMVAKMCEMAGVLVNKKA